MGYPNQFGTVLVKKETLDDSLKTIIGAPVIINHTNVTEENADDLRVGVISNAWYNNKDGWYWCEGVIWDETAQNLITDKKWSVSCSYDYLQEDNEGGTENNIPYDREFTKLNFVHLALVNNPRYERANIVFNSKTEVSNNKIDYADIFFEALAEVIIETRNNSINNEKWITIHPHGKDSDDYRRIKLEDGETPKEAIDRVYKKDGGNKKQEPKEEKPQEKPQEKAKEETKTSAEDLKKKIAEYKEKARKFGGENSVLGRKYINFAKEAEQELKDLENKELAEIKGDDAILNKLTEMSDEILELAKKRWHHSYGTPERQEVEDKFHALSQQASELSKKLSFMGDTWKNADGDKVEISKFEDGRFVLTTFTDKGYFTSKRYDYYDNADEIFKLKEAQQKAYEKAQEKAKEKEAKKSKKVEYKKGAMPKAKTREEAKALAEKFNIADNINYGNLSVDICNAMNESANDILAEFPKIRELNKEFGSLQAKNKSLIDEAFEIQGEALAIPIRKNMEKLKERYGAEDFERYYGNEATIEKRITEKVKSILKDRIRIIRASGEIAHCRYVPPEQAGIVWNEKYKNSPNFNEASESGFHPKNSGSLKAVVDHEFGHQIDRFIQLKGSSRSKSYIELRNYYDSLKTANIGSELSRYATKNFAEFIAEGFSEYKNNPEVRPMAKKIGELLTQAYKEVENYV